VNWYAVVARLGPNVQEKIFDSLDVLCPRRLTEVKVMPSIFAIRPEQAAGVCVSFVDRISDNCLLAEILILPPVSWLCPLVGVDVFVMFFVPETV
jgi:hypothetical protein